jgi:hypothetical protein
MKVNTLVFESDWTDYVTAKTGIEPTRPGLYTFVATTRTTINLTWLPLVGADTGGTDSNPLTITYYHLYMDDGKGGEIIKIASQEGSLTTERTI